MKANYQVKVFYPGDKGTTPREFDHSVEAETPLDAAGQALLAFDGRRHLVRTITVGDVICVGIGSGDDPAIFSHAMGRWFIVDSGKRLREVSGSYARMWMRETKYMDRIFGVKAAVESHVVPSPSGGRAAEVGASAGARDFDFQ
jgi:hypothetical protein